MKFPPLKFSLVLVVIVSLIINSCDEPTKKDDKDFQQNLSSFNNTMTNLDDALNLMDSMQQKVDNIKRARDLGEISDDEASSKLEQVNNAIGRKIAKTYNTAPLVGIPTWAAKLGLSQPTNMVFDKDYSQSTSESNKSEGFNSILLVYHGNYNVAIRQAAIIAKKANIPMSKDYKDALALSREYDIETIKGASYINFEFGSKNNPRYSTSITVDENGTLTINVTDTQEFVERLKE